MKSPSSHLTLFLLASGATSQFVLPSEADSLSATLSPVSSSLAASRSKSNYSATITNGPVATNGVDVCPKCLVVARGVPISQVYWIDSTIGVTIDTVSLIVTQYNRSAVTSTTTVFGDVNSVNTSTVTDAYSLLREIMYSAAPGQYADTGAGGIVLADGNDGRINDVLSIPYPTPYVGIGGVSYYRVPQSTALQSSTGSKASGSGTEDCPIASFNFFDPAATLGNGEWTSIMFSATYYEVMTELATDPWQTEILRLNNASLSSWVVADPSIISQYPEIPGCSFLAAGFGPPAVKIPVSALTATTTTTVQGTLHPSIQTPKPAETISTLVPSQTSSPQSTELPQSIWQPFFQPQDTASKTQDSLDGSASVISASEKESTMPNDIQATTATHSSLPTQSNSQQCPSGLTDHPIEKSNSYQGDSFQTVQTGNAEEITTAYQDTASQESPMSILAAAPDVSADQTSLASSTGGGETISDSNIEIMTYKPSATPLEVPVLTYHGTPHTADISSHFVIEDQTLVPGSVITVSGISLSIASDASVAVVGGSTQPLEAVTVTPTSVDSPQRPVVTFASQTYTASGLSSPFLITGQTLTANGVITVSGTPISYIPGSYNTAEAELTTRDRKITFGGQTFTADSASNFIIAGQTLTANGAITVSGYPISYTPGSSASNEGSNSQGNSIATTASFTTDRAITFAGQTYTADSASNFIIAGQTLTPGAVVTVSGTPVSYAAAGTDAVIGSSTEPVNLGTVIMGGFNTPSQTGSEPFTGGSSILLRGSRLYWLGVGTYIGWIMCVL